MSRALAGYEVSIADISKEVLERAITTIDHNIQRQVARGRVTEEDKQGGDEAHSHRRRLRHLRVAVAIS